MSWWKKLKLKIFLFYHRKQTRVKIVNKIHYAQYKDEQGIWCNISTKMYPEISSAKNRIKEFLIQQDEYHTNLYNEVKPKYIKYP